MKWILAICHDLKHVLEFSQQKRNSDSHSWRLTCFPPPTKMMFLYLFQWEQKKPNSHTWRMNSSAKVSLGAGMVQVELLPCKSAFYVLFLLWHRYLKCCKTKPCSGLTSTTLLSLSPCTKLSQCVVPKTCSYFYCLPIQTNSFLLKP